MGVEGLKLLREAGDRFNLLVVSEVMEISQIAMMMPYVDIFQVGARNMQNFNLLRELGKVRKPVLLKRGIAATIEELLLSAEYICPGGNYEIILCERGIRTFETYTRNTHGHFRDSHHPQTLASAYDRRPIARHRTPRQSRSHGARRGRRRRRRAADRSPSPARQGVVGWRAVAIPRTIRKADGRTPHDRARGRAKHRVTALHVCHPERGPTRPAVGRVADSESKDPGFARQRSQY